MVDRRASLTTALALLGFIWAAWHIYSGWGLVTLDVKNKPVGKVLASISRQGGIEIASALDPATPVTIKVKRVPPVEALDIVAVRTDASWRLSYLGAPDEKAIDAALAAFRAGGETDGWTAHGAGGLNLVTPASGAALDLRGVQWNPSEPGRLAALLEEAAEKTGVLLAAPTDWKPSVSAPKAGPISRIAPELFGQAGGVSREVFLIRARPQGEDDDSRGARGGNWIARGPDSGERGGGGCAPWATRSAPGNALKRRSRFFQKANSKRPARTSR